MSEFHLLVWASWALRSVSSFYLNCFHHNLQPLLDFQTLFSPAPLFCLLSVPAWTETWHKGTRSTDLTLCSHPCLLCQDGLSDVGLREQGRITLLCCQCSQQLEYWNPKTIRSSPPFLPCFVHLLSSVWKSFLAGEWVFFLLAMWPNGWIAAQKKRKAFSHFLVRYGANCCFLLLFFLLLFTFY